MLNSVEAFQSERPAVFAVYGSVFENRSDLYSDLDLLEIIDANRASTIVRTRYGSIDWQRVTTEALKQNLDRAHDGNNSFYLNALTRCHIAADQNHLLEAAIEKAHRLRSGKPPALAAGRALDLHRSLQKMLQSLCALAARSSRSNIELTIFRMRADQIFLRLLSWFFEASQLWGDSFRALLLRPESLPLSIYPLWDRHRNRQEQPSEIAANLIA